MTDEAETASVLTDPVHPDVHVDDTQTKNDPVEGNKLSELHDSEVLHDAFDAFHYHEPEPPLAEPQFPGPHPRERIKTRSEFYAQDRFHAMTHVQSLVIPAEITTALIAELDGLSHMGPVHVVLAPGGDEDFQVQPFDFVRV